MQNPHGSSLPIDILESQVHWVKPVDMADLDQLLDLGWKMTGLKMQTQEVQATIRAGTVTRAEQYKTADGGYHFPDVVLVAVGQKN